MLLALISLYVAQADAATSFHFKCVGGQTELGISLTYDQHSHPQSGLTALKGTFEIAGQGKDTAEVNVTNDQLQWGYFYIYGVSKTTGRKYSLRANGKLLDPRFPSQTDPEAGLLHIIYPAQNAGVNIPVTCAKLAN